MQIKKNNNNTFEDKWYVELECDMPHNINLNSKYFA